MKLLYMISVVLIALAFGSAVRAAETSDESEEGDSSERLLPDISSKRELLVHRRDNQGCDAVIASCGSKGRCCDVHDQCYKQYGCTAASWLYLWGNCVGCNNAVMGCVAARNPGKSSCCARGTCGTPQGR